MGENGPFVISPGRPELTGKTMSGRLTMFMFRDKNQHPRMRPRWSLAKFSSELFSPASSLQGIWRSKFLPTRTYPKHSKTTEI